MNSTNYKLFLNRLLNNSVGLTQYGQNQKNTKISKSYFSSYISHSKKRNIYVQSKEKSIGRGMTMHKIVNTWLDNRDSWQLVQFVGACSPRGLRTPHEWSPSTKRFRATSCLNEGNGLQASYFIFFFIIHQRFSIGFRSGAIFRPWKYPDVVVIKPCHGARWCMTWRFVLLERGTVVSPHRNLTACHPESWYIHHYSFSCLSARKRPPRPRWEEQLQTTTPGRMFNCLRS